jgi:sugar phosphate isomerase/epimerase
MSIQDKLSVMGIVYRNMPVAEAAATIKGLGFSGVQISPRFADCDPADLKGSGEKITAAFAEQGVRIVALDAYVNLVNPDRSFLESEIQRFKNTIRNCKYFGTTVVATETGTKGNTTHKGFVAFEAHPDNETEETWNELKARLQDLLVVAEENGVTILLEGVITNVINTPDRALRMLEEIGSPNLRLVMDVFNYIYMESLGDVPAAMEAAVKKLAPWSAIAHAKDLLLKDGKMVRPGPGLGIMTPAEYGHFLKALDREAPSLPLVIEHVTLEQVPGAKKFIEDSYAS